MSILASPQLFEKLSRQGSVVRYSIRCARKNAFDVRYYRMERASADQGHVEYASGRFAITQDGKISFDGEVISDEDGFWWR